MEATMFTGWIYDHSVPSSENRDLRQLLWHRHRLVQIRTRIMKRADGGKSKLWSEQGRTELEELALAPGASRRRCELLELLENSTIKRSVE